MSERSPEDQAVFDRHPNIPQPTLDTMRCACMEERHDDRSCQCDAEPGCDVCLACIHVCLP